MLYKREGLHRPVPRAPSSHGFAVHNIAVICRPEELEILSTWSQAVRASSADQCGYDVSFLRDVKYKSHTSFLGYANNVNGDGNCGSRCSIPPAT